MIVSGPIIIICVITVVLYIWYANIVTNKNKALEALSGIDVQLKKRSNLIPNILKIAQKFMDHERDLLNKITELRTRTSQDYDLSDVSAVKDHLQAAGALEANMGRLLVTVEDYPDLKSNETMLQAQRTYNEVEAQISAARRFYNSSVTTLNNSIEIFPGSYFAKLAKAQSMPFYEVDEASKVAVDAEDYLR